jgi:hypothetical protein
MDLERLTKHQVVLLTLLVSFVTSIATGIVTVSLMEQAPVGVTRTINQIVEHTVEKVVPASQGSSITTTEKTVVVKDDDLAAQSIASVQKAIVRITPRGRDNLIARGILVDKNGTVLTDRTALTPYRTERFDALLFNGQRVIAILDPSSGPLATLTLVLGTSSAAVPAKLADASALKLGQSVIRIGGEGEDTVGTGVIAALPSLGSGGESGSIEATVESSTPGAVLLTLFGEIIGITTGASLSQGSDFYTVPGHVSAPAP